MVKKSSFFLHQQRVTRSDEKQLSETGWFFDPVVKNWKVFCPIYYLKKSFFLLHSLSIKINNQRQIEKKCRTTGIIVKWQNRKVNQRLILLPCGCFYPLLEPVLSNFAFLCFQFLPLSLSVCHTWTKCSENKMT